MPLTLTSPAFIADTDIPAGYACDGENLSPPLSWSNIPAATKSLVLIVDDPDAPDPATSQRIWTHWLLYNSPPDTNSLPAGVKTSHLAEGSQEGLNDCKKAGYGGPCPPIGRHRYFHELYALDIVLPDVGQASKSQIEQAILGHVLAHAELIGRHQRPQRQ